ncbi:MAG TPA: phage holin family protein [Polyangiaceae bacterium]
MHESSLALAIVHLLITALSVVVVAKALPGVKVQSYGTAVVFALVVGILNAVAWYLLAPLTWTFAVLTLGVGILIVNGLVFLFAGNLVGVKFSGCATAAIASICVSILNWVFNLILSGFLAPSSAPPPGH